MFAVARRPPRNEYLLLLAHPPITTPYTARLSTDSANSTPMSIPAICARQPCTYETDVVSDTDRSNDTFAGASTSPTSKWCRGSAGSSGGLVSAPGTIVLADSAAASGLLPGMTV